MKRHRSSRLLAFVLLAALIATACGSLAPESLAFAEEEPRPRRTVLRIATYTSDGLTAAVEQWEREHPTAEVIIDQREIDDHHSLILDGRASTETPDIVVYDVDYSATFRNQTDLFVDLDTLGGKEFEDRSLAWRWEQGVADDGTLVGLPVDVGGLALVVRRDLLGSGVTAVFERGEANWCELIALGDRYSDRTTRAFLPEASDLFEAILNQARVRFHNADARLIHSTNPAVQEAWDYTMGALGERPLFEDPCPDNEDVLRITANLPALSEEWKAALQTDEFAAVLAPASMLETIQATAPATFGEWRVVPVPRGGAGNSGGSQLAIHAESMHPDLAYNLIAHLTDPATQLRTFRDAGAFPAAESLYDDTQLVGYTAEFFGDSPIGQTYANSASSFVAAPDGPEHQLILEEFRSGVTRVESGNQSPDDAWSEVLWRIELLLK
jgi:cellobiose transport system substrate-binding protein